MWGRPGADGVGHADPHGLLAGRGDERAASDDGIPHPDADLSDHRTVAHADRDPADAVAASLSTFSDEVDSLQRDGVIDNDTAKTLDDRVRDIQQALRDDEVEKVVDERDKLVEEYDKAVGEGNISTDAAQRLDPLLSDVTDSVDAYAG